MALDIKVGSFLSPTSTGSLAVTGVGFAPKFVLVFATTGTPDNTLANNLVFSIGAAVKGSGSSIIQNRVAMNDLHAAATSTVASTPNDTNILLLSDGFTVYSVAAVTSIDSGGFTLNFTTINATQYPINYLVIGGSDLTGVTHGLTVCPTSTGNQSLITSTDVKLILANGTNRTAAGGGTGLVASVGAATGVSDQRAVGINSEFNQATMDTCGKQVATQLIACVNNNLDTAPQCAVTNFSATDITVNWTSVANPGLRYTYSIFRGTLQAKVGTETSRTSTGTKATTGVGFRPELLIAFGRINSTSTAIVAGNFFSYGMSDGTTTRSVGVSSEDNTANAQSHCITSTKLIHRIAESGGSAVTVVAADLSSLDSDGFTLNWTTADATAREFYWIAIGEAPPPNITLSPGVAQATASAIDPDVLAGDVSSSPGVAQAAASAIDTEVQNATLVTPGVAEALAACIDPVMVAGAVSLAPGVASASSSATSPSVIAGAVSQTPGVASAAASAIDATVDASATLAPGVAAASASGVDPDVVAGAVSLAPGVASAISTANDVAIVPGAVSGSPSVAIATAACVDLSVEVSTAATPGVAGASAIAINPGIVPGAVTQSPGVASAGSSASSPVVLVGAVNQSPGIASAAATAVDATVDVPTTLAPGVAQASASAVDVLAIPGAVVMLPDIAQASATALGPTLIVGAVEIAVTSIALATASAFEPIVVVLPLVFGPYSSLASQFFVCGSVSGQGFMPSSLAGQCSAPLSAAGQAWLPGSAARQSFTPGSEGGQAR